MDKYSSKCYYKLIPSLLEDNRHKSIGLSEEEARVVLVICCKFANRRDHLDDLYQTALASLFSAFKSSKRDIEYRKAFISRVVNNSMCCNIVRKNKKDLIYRCLNVFDALDHLHPHLKDKTWIKFRYV